jgi:hypothetical protein
MRGAMTGKRKRAHWCIVEAPQRPIACRWHINSKEKVLCERDVLSGALCILIEELRWDGEEEESHANFEAMT